MWIYPTGDGSVLEAWSSKDRGKWKKHGILIRQSDIKWIKDDGAPRHYLWAPDVVRTNGRYLLFYSAGPQGPTPSRLGIATGHSPAGPSIDSEKPLLIGGAGFEAIDPMVFFDSRSRKSYLYAGGSADAKLRMFDLHLI